MKTLRLLTLSLLIILSTFSTAEAQTTITGNGKICSGVVSECGTFTITFNPKGGAVTGSMRYVVTTRTQTSTVVDTTTATLNGTFDGGNNGRISGTATGQSVSSNGGSIGFSGTWEGQLRAEGSGDGSWSTSSRYLQCTRACVWTVTYSAEAFRSALSTVTPTLPKESATPPKLTLTPTGVPVIAKNITLDPMVKTFIAVSPSLDQATKSILNQDSALIARDDKNNFYAINNQGKSIPLPPALGAMIKFSHNFAVLNNDQLYASSEHGSIRGTINGGGDFVMLNKIAPEMKDKDYVAVEGTTVRYNLTASSAMVDGKCLLNRTPKTTSSNGSSVEVNLPSSSEHCSVRGTINGGGDFINNLQPREVSWRSDASDVPYLGLQVELINTGAVVRAVAASSAAQKAGLQVSDVIQEVDGTTLNAQTTLESLVLSHKVGDEIQLKIIRSGSPQVIKVKLGAQDMPRLITPSAEIFLGASRVVVDVGFNGYTGLYVIEGKARVGEVDVEAGYAVIVAPLNKVSKPIKLNTNDVNQWWNESKTETPVAPPPTAKPETAVAPTVAATPNVVPTPNNDLSTAIGFAVMAGGVVLLCGLGVFGFGAVFWWLRRR